MRILVGRVSGAFRTEDKSRGSWGLVIAVIIRPSWAYAELYSPSICCRTIAWDSRKNRWYGHIT